MTTEKQEKVTVVLEPDQSPNFHLDSKLLKGNKLTFKNEGFPGFSLDFKIDDPTGSGYRFPSDPKLALAAKQIQSPNDHCPAQGESWDQFEPVSVSNNGKTLTVRNLNEFPTEFGFTLFVTQSPDPPQGPYLALDPIGDNQNGISDSGGFAISTTRLAIGAGVVVVALVALYQLGVLGN